MPATLNLQRLRLQERTMATNAARVDRDAGVLQAVKIIGTKSANGREYPLEVLRKAAPLYEGVAVNVNHPTRGNETRSVADRFGTLKNVRAGMNGLYGDLHYIRSHPLAEQVLEMAVRMPSLMGLSHNADGVGRTGTGGFVVQEISKVISVDLVCDPATNKSLFESIAPPPRGIVSSEKDPAAPAKTPPSVIDQENREGASQASAMIKKLYARLVAGVVNDEFLSTEEKTATVTELIADEAYAIGQVLKFGRFYRRFGPLPGDPVAIDAVGNEVMAEHVVKPWGGNVAESLRRADAMAGQVHLSTVRDTPKVARSTGYQRGENFKEHLLRPDLGTVAQTQQQPQPPATGKAPAYEKGAGFMRHLRGVEAS